jgi:hypothetical protein
VILQWNMMTPSEHKEQTMKLTMYPLTLFSSTAKVFIASCIRSKLVDFHTKSAENPWVQSEGTPSLFRSSRPISSETSKLARGDFRISGVSTNCHRMISTQKKGNSLFGILITWPTPSHGLCGSTWYLSRSSSPAASLTSPLSSLGSVNQAIRF